ncbi:MAG: GspD-like [Pseudomonadota bacterium]|jgi:general secretion pathway protein D
MSSKFTATGEAGRKSQLRIGLAASVAAVVALSGCTSVDTGQQRRAPDKPVSSGADMQQRPPSEVRLSADAPGQQAEPVIQKGTGRFVDSGASTARSGRGNIVVKLVDVPTADAVQQILGDTLGLNYVIEGEASGSVTIQTARPVDQRSLLQMLAGALASNNLVLINEGGFYRVAPADAAATASRIVSYGANPTDLRVGPGVQVVPLRHISAVEMEKILRPIASEGAVARVDTARNLLILKEDARNLVSMLEMVDLFDVDYMAGMSFAVLPVKNTSASLLVGELEQLFGAASGSPMAGVVRFIPIERLNSVLAISAQPHHLDQVQAWMRQLDRTGSMADQSFHVIPLQNRPAREVAELLQKSLTPADSAAEAALTAVNPALTPVITDSTAPGASVPAVEVTVPAISSPSSKPARILADEANNSLVILASAEEYQLLQQVIALLDVTPNQVMLEATIAEVTLNDDLAFGITWFLQDGEFDLSFSDLDNGAVASTFPGFSVLVDGADGRAALNAVASVTDVKVLSSPSLMVLDNRTATLQVGDQVPVVTQTAVSTIDPDAPIVNSVELRDTGVILKVTPRVNEGGRVMLDIEQEVSDVVETRTSGIDSPTIQQRKIKTSVAVDNGETIALGGLIRDKVTDGETKVPLLGDIPAIGELFRSTTQRNERTELVVLITPRVVGGADDARRITQELTDRMRGVGAAMEDAARRAANE